MRDDFSRAKFMFLHSLDPKRKLAPPNSLPESGRQKRALA
jgi:hypothetical protein